MMFNIDLSGKNKYYTLYKEIRANILRGKLKAGEKLPSKRALAEELGVSVVTVQLAYEQLLAEGYVVSRERSGYFVEKVWASEPQPRNRTEKIPAETEKKYKIDFVKGSTPADMFPFSVWTRLMRKVLADCGEHLLERVPCDGDGQLKRAVSDYLYRSRGVDADPRYIVIGAGAEHLYGVIVQLLGRDKTFAVENPCYGKISYTYVLNGARTVAVNVTPSGMDCERAEKSGAYVVHVSPSHQFPTGAVMPASARSRLLAWAESSGGYVIEDDYDSEFRMSGKPLQSMLALKPERVIYINTFSKSLAPSMRMGYMVLPSALYEKYIKIFSRTANIVPLFEQKTLAAMLNGGYFERHISRLKNYYRGVRAEVTRKLTDAGAKVIDTGSGLHMLAEFAGVTDDNALKERAARAGVNIKCLSDYLIAPCEVKCRAVINYSGVTCAELENFKI